MNIGTSKVPRHQRVRPVTSCHAKETKIRHARLFLFWSLPGRSAPVAARPTNVSFTSYDVSGTNSGGAGDGLGSRANGVADEHDGVTTTRSSSQHSARFAESCGTFIFAALDNTVVEPHLAVNPCLECHEVSSIEIRREPRRTPRPAIRLASATTAAQRGVAQPFRILPHFTSDL